MKKILMGILIAFLLLITFFMLTGRVKIGEWKILGIEDIKNENEKLDSKIEDISKLTSVTYPQKYKELESAQKSLLQSKQDYEDKLAYSTESEIESANRLENYNIEFLWNKIGTYATKQGIGLKLEIQNGSSQDLKNIVFSATGKYIPITDFIYSIEDDDELGFSIENFKLVPNTEDGSVLLATFKVTDIAINIKELTTTATQDTTATENGTNTTTTNTSNSTSNNTTNSMSNNTVNNTTNSTSNNTVNNTTNNTSR